LSAATRPAAADLKVGDAFAVVMANTGRFGLAVLERHLAGGTGSFDFGTAMAPNQLYITYNTLAAQMSSDREIVHGAYGG
jgi:hypothetical protein